MNAAEIDLAQYWQFFAVPTIAGLSMALLCGFLGCFVLLRKLAFLADTIAHASILGIALGFVLGLAPKSTLIPFSVCLSLGLTWLSGKGRSANEGSVALTAVAFSLCMGAGILILNRYSVGGQELVHILFGDLLWISRGDLLAILLLGVPVVVFLGIHIRKLTLMFLDPDLASVEGIPVRFFEYAFMLCVGLVIALCVKLVGVVLVTTLITVPPLIAGRLVRSFYAQLFCSPLVGLLCTVFGIIASVNTNLPTGPCIATVSGIVFLGLTLIRVGAR